MYTLYLLTPLFQPDVIIQDLEAGAAYTANVTVYTMSSLTPSIFQPDVIIQDLEAGAAYTASVTAYNKKGTSLVRQILVETLQPPESQLVEEKLEQGGGGGGQGGGAGGLGWQLGGGVLAGSLLSLALITGNHGGVLAFYVRK